ncbi:MAG: glycoside hydrolase family 95 protein [Cytophagales bacterium]|nr:MAG: glycoside hydrolase family 95 protein [Cytophagales bacterium]
MKKTFLTLLSLAFVLSNCEKKDKNLNSHKIVEKKQVRDSVISTTPLVLWFTSPSSVEDSIPYLHNGSTNIHGDAEGKGWEEALPIGNGRLAAMVFGGKKFERIQLNEESLWSFDDKKLDVLSNQNDLKEIQSLIFDKKYTEAQAIIEQKMVANSDKTPQYQPLSDLMLEMTDIDANSVTDYYRDLHIDSAVATVHYHVGEKLYTREIFASFPANIIVMKISCSHPASINAKISLLRETEAETFRSPFDSTLLIQRGKLASNGMKFETQIKAVYKGGTVRNETKKLIAQNVDELYIYVSAATNFKNPDYALFAKTNLINAVSKNYTALKEEHIADYKFFFNRVELNLNFKDKAFDLPTNERVAKVKNGVEDKYLTELLFQYGRYLLISSSRSNSLPANLQGKWNEHLNAINGSGYKIPYSMPMIYSFAEATALAELKLPVLNLLDSAVKKSKIISKDLFGNESSFAFDYLFPTGKPNSMIQNNGNISPLGLAWLSNIYLETYLYNPDAELLKNKIYPFLKQSSLFLSNYLVEVPTGNFLEGKLVVCPSSSYGNTFEVNGENFKYGYASALDQILVRDLFKNTLFAINELTTENYKFDPNHKLLLENKLSKLASIDDTTTKIPSSWLSGLISSASQQNNSLVQVYGIYPSMYFNKPKEISGLVSNIKSDILPKITKTGMSNAYMATVMARLLEPKAADDFLLEHLKSSVSLNLLSSNPPFSMEGNSLFTQAVSEMILQSYNGEIQFAPALPSTWEEGNIKGFKAQGGFNCNVEWKGSKVYASILSTKGKICKIRSRFSIKVFSAGTEVETTKIGKDLYVFKTSVAASYTVTYTNNKSGGGSKGLGIWPDLGINLGL